MQAIILAAGRGKRMGKLTDNVPKPLLKINGRPILEYILAGLPREVDEVILVVGYFGHKIKNHFGAKHQGRSLQYLWQMSPSGTAGALWQTRKSLKGKFLVLMGDDLYHQNDIKKIVKHDLAVLVKEVAELSRFGMIEVDDQVHLIKIIEAAASSTSNLANTGAYVLDERIFEYPLVPLLGGTEFGLPQTLAQMADRHKIKVEKADFWHANTEEEDLAVAEEMVKKYLRYKI
ncbi:MAG: nucleotidyltransferase family protein [Patescibacteria group bacterium]